jgi:hypothetical protein
MILDTKAISALLEWDEGIDSILSGADKHHIPVFPLGEYRHGLLNALKAESFVLVPEGDSLRPCRPRLA